MFYCTIWALFIFLAKESVPKSTECVCILFLKLSRAFCIQHAFVHGSSVSSNALNQWMCKGRCRFWKLEWYNKGIEFIWVSLCYYFFSFYPLVCILIMKLRQNLTFKIINLSSFKCFVNLHFESSENFKSPYLIFFKELTI